MKIETLQPYETVFSWLSRTHCRHGAGNVAHTYQALLGKAKVRLHPYLPNYMDAFARLNGLSTEVMLNRHTLYPLFRFFLGDEGKSLGAIMCSSSRSAVLAANIPHAKFDVRLQHKYCSLCAVEQRQKQGFAIFDIRLQLPGMIMCPFHARELDGIACGDGELDSHIALPRATTITNVVSSSSAVFARFCVDVITLLSTQSLPAHQTQNYLNLLDRKGFITANGSLRQKPLISALQRFYSTLTLEDGASTLTSFSFLGPLLRQRTQFPAHPLKHLLFSNWLFEGDAKRYTEDIAPVQQYPLDLPATESMDALTLNLLKQKVSFATISKKVGKSRCYVRRIAQLNGIEYQQNTLMFDERIRYRVIIQALLGRHRRQIASNLGVGVGYVEQVISNTKGLRPWRKYLTHKQKLVRAAYAIEQASIAHPQWLQKDIKKHLNKAFFYLYQHDRDTLKRLLPPKQRPQRPVHNWDAEDKRLCEAIGKLDNPHQLSISALGRAINDKGNLRKNLDKLSLTRLLVSGYQYHNH